MADLRGEQLKDSYQNVVTRGAGNKLENGNGVEFADLDDKASLSSVTLSPFIGANVKNLGAVGDGVEDDTQVINSAFSNFKHIYLPPGTYKISDELKPKEGSIIVCTPNTIIKPSSNTASYINFEEHNVEWHGGKVEVEGFNTSSSIGAVYIEKTKDITIKDLEVYGVDTDPTVGFLINGCEDIKLVRCVFNGHLQTPTKSSSAKYGICTWDSSNLDPSEIFTSKRIQFINCEAHGVWANNITSYVTEDWLIHGCKASKGGHGMIACSSGRKGIISNNTVYDFVETDNPTGEGGIEVEDGGGRLINAFDGDVSDVTIIGNHVRNCGPLGIYFRGNSGATEDATRILPHNITIVGNVISNCDLAIQGTTARDVTIVGNTINECDRSIGFGRNLMGLTFHSNVDDKGLNLLQHPSPNALIKDSWQDEKLQNRDRPIKPVWYFGSEINRQGVEGISPEWYGDDSLSVAPSSFRFHEGLILENNSERMDYVINNPVESGRVLMQLQSMSTPPSDGTRIFDIHFFGPFSNAYRLSFRPGAGEVRLVYDGSVITTAPSNFIINNNTTRYLIIEFESGSVRVLMDNDVVIDESGIPAVTAEHFGFSTKNFGADIRIRELSIEKSI